MADAEHSFQKIPRGRLTALVIAGSVTLALIGSYLGLCCWVAFSGRLLPNSESLSVNVGNMTYADANAAVSQAFDDYYADDNVVLSQAATGTSVSIPTNLMSLSVENTGGNFITGGASFLKSLSSPVSITPEVTFSSSSEASLQDAVANFSSQCNQALSASAMQVTDTDLVITKGFSGYQVDEAATAQAVVLLLEEAVSAVNTNNHVALSLEAVSSKTEPVTPDFDLLYQQVFVEPQNATLSKETFDITPSVTGVSFDVAAAKQSYAALAEGESCTIPLTKTEPDVTTEKLKSSLFSDVLGSVTTTIGGIPNRVSNVKNAARYCNQVILLPGETFSYCDTVSPFTEARGYLPAPAYVGGASVDQIGGGICQVSSSIYYAALKANLEIVERHAHMYAVGYVPDGMDATVYSSSLDFRFKNNTEYPIKIVTSTSKRSLTVTLYGTKANSNYVVMTNVRNSTTNYEVVYEPDATVPVGTTVQKVTPYTGRTVEVYRNLYSGNGTLISSTLESSNTYKKRDEVIQYNPADAVSLGLAASATTNNSATQPTTPSTNVTTPTSPGTSSMGSTTTTTDTTAPTDTGSDTTATSTDTTQPTDTTGTDQTQATNP